MAEFITIVILIVSVFVPGLMEERKTRIKDSLKSERLRKMQ